MDNRIFFHRVAAHLSADEVAQHLKIDTDTYKTWELNHAFVPEEKLKSLAILFQLPSIRPLIGSHPYIDVQHLDGSFAPETDYDDSPAFNPRVYNRYPGHPMPDLTYFGMVVFYLKGGESLMLPISLAMKTSLTMQANTSDVFFVSSLDNRLVAIKRQSICGMSFLPSDNFPLAIEAEAKQLEQIMLPDHRDWEVLDDILNNDNLEEEYWGPLETTLETTAAAICSIVDPSGRFAFDTHPVNNVHHLFKQDSPNRFDLMIERMEFSVCGLRSGKRSAWRLDPKDTVVHLDRVLNPRSSQFAIFELDIDHLEYVLQSEIDYFHVPTHHFISSLARLHILNKAPTWTYPFLDHLTSLELPDEKLQHAPEKGKYDPEYHLRPFPGRVVPRSRCA